MYEANKKMKREEDVEKKVVIELHMNKKMAQDLLDSLNDLVYLEQSEVNWAEHGYDEDIMPFGFFEDEITTAIKDTFGIR